MILFLNLISFNFYEIFLSVFLGNEQKIIKNQLTLRSITKYVDNFRRRFSLIFFLLSSDEWSVRPPIRSKMATLGR